MFRSSALGNFDLNQYIEAMDTVEFGVFNEGKEYSVVAIHVPKMCFRISLGRKYLGTLCKVYNETWEWQDGDETLKDAIAIGRLIEKENPAYFSLPYAIQKLA